MCPQWLRRYVQRTCPATAHPRPKAPQLVAPCGRLRASSSSAAPTCALWRTRTWRVDWLAKCYWHQLCKAQFPQKPFAYFKACGFAASPPPGGDRITGSVGAQFWVPDLIANTPSHPGAGKNLIKTGTHSWDHVLHIFWHMEPSTPRVTISINGALRTNAS